MTVFSLILIKQGCCQDIHFSSVGFSPMFFNPAMTAFMNNTFRISTIYRNQWQTVSKGYNTFFLAVEMQPYLSIDNSKGVGVGFAFTKDVAGSLSFGERDIMVSTSFFFALDRNKKTYLSLGLEGMRKNWSMSLANAKFNQQGQYDDDITYSQLNTYDFSLGISLQHAKDEQHLFNTSIALFHINTPSLSRFKDNKIYMHQRFFANLSYLFPYATNEYVSINPQIFYQHQHSFNEWLVGADVLFQLRDAIFISQIFTIGLYCRNLESIVISPKFKYNNLITGMAYDVNISRLSKVSKTYGAIEIWLSYSFKPFFNRQKLTKIPCPIF
ncbi:MAG: PorP/SprF family type IX secretion system membrane protein [Bacteroidales bacterium]